MLRTSRLIAGTYLIATLVLIAITVMSGPVGWAPLPLPTAAPPIRLDIAISSEKEAWLRSAIERFAGTNPTVNGRAIKVRIRVAGSRDLIMAIEREGYQPTVVSPASTLQLAELQQWRADWLREPAQPLAFSPVVALMRQSSTTDGIDNPWQLWQHELPDRIKSLKIGISSPVLSNGGLQTLITLAAQYHQTTELTIAQAQDSGFRDWLQRLSQRVVDWSASTGTLTTDFVIRPGVYDIITTYENLALQAFRQGEGRGLQSLRIAYPATPIISDHPFAILNAPWVGNAEREAAIRLRTFLLSPTEQSIAMREYGFRPGNPQVRIDLDDSASLFGRYRDNGVQLDFPSQLALPTTDVVAALINTWRAATGIQR